MKMKCIVLVLLLLNCATYAKDTITGIYTENVSPHEEISTMMILPDNQFCFSFMGGDLDMLMAGTWTINKNKIIFREQREEKDHYDASVHLDKNIMGKTIILNGIRFQKPEIRYLPFQTLEQLPKNLNCYLSLITMVGRVLNTISLLMVLITKVFLSVKP